MVGNTLQGTHILRMKVLRGICLALGVLAFFMTFTNILFYEKYVFAAAIFVFSLFSFYLYFQSNTLEQSNWKKILYLVFAASLVVIGPIIKPFDSGNFVWTLILPILFYLLLGIHHGRYLSASTLFLQSANIFLINEPSGYFLREPVMVNFSFCYLTIWVISHVYESNRVKIEESLEKLAYTDVLTGANNRLARKCLLEELYQQKQPFYLMTLDLDYFKKVNDTYGHETGDDVLQQFTERLIRLVGDDNVFRVGGEEFCIILRHSSDNSVVSLAEMIRCDVANTPLKSQDLFISITVSIGVAKYLPHMTLSELIRLADNRLYQAKSLGRNRVVFSDSLSILKLGPKADNEELIAESV